MTAGSTYFIIVASWSNVIKGRYNIRLNYFSEITLMVHCYIYFLFSDFLPDPAMRFYIGYIVMMNTIFNFSVNVLLIFI